MLAAIAEGPSVLHHFLTSADCLATLEILRAMGVNIKINDDTVQVQGVGLTGLQQAEHALDCGNSGTSMRLLTGLLCGQNFSSQLKGDASLNRRPMQRCAIPLRQMGANITLSPENTPPIEIEAVECLHGISYSLPVASAQVKSALLFAALYAQEATQLDGLLQTRDHTERMLRLFGCSLSGSDTSIRLEPGATLNGQTLHIPGDLSSAAFFIVAACIVAQSHLKINNVGINPTRSAIIRILQHMGADICLHQRQQQSLEPRADIEVRAAPLQGIEIPQQLVANAIDEFPILLIAAACAQGTTTVSGAEELRHKESDRIAAMAAGLQACGIQIEMYQDGITVHGSTLNGAQVHSYGDHRIAMAFLVAGLVASEPIQVHDCANIDTSFPHFVQLANSIGFDICPC